MAARDLIKHHSTLLLFSLLFAILLMGKEVRRVVYLSG